MGRCRSRSGFKMYQTNRYKTTLLSAPLLSLCVRDGGEISTVLSEESVHRA